MTKQGYEFHVTDGHGGDTWLTDYRPIMGDGAVQEHWKESDTFNVRSPFLLEEGQDVEKRLLKNSVLTALRYKKLTGLTKKQSTVWGDASHDATGLLFYSISESVKTIRFTELTDETHIKLFGLYFACKIARDTIPFFCKK